MNQHTDHTPLTEQQLDEITARAAHLFEYVTMPTEADQLAGVDVPALIAEVRRLRTSPSMVCIDCETPIGWVDCPTGGWWAHETHPADDHDADPKPAAASAAGGAR